jgi:hypothetical protein
MERIVGISEAAEALGVAISTLRRWEASGKMVAEHTVGGASALRSRQAVPGTVPRCRSGTKVHLRQCGDEVKAQWNTH